MSSGNLTTASSDENNSAPSTKNDLILLKEELLQAITSRVTELIHPLQTQLNELVNDLCDTPKIAENTAELALTLQDDVKTLRSSDSHLNTRLTALQNRWRMLNLKFRGIEEGMEEARKGRPRDILVQFLYPQTRDRILKEARIQGFLPCNTTKVQVLLNLSSETLDKRRSLKIFANKLFKAFVGVQLRTCMSTEMGYFIKLLTTVLGRLYLPLWV
ncbi:UNVERIFIED_CONTAM: hypothetical protein K2H54_003510 [Gekko kuhli]